MIFNLFKKKTFNIYRIYINDKTKHKHLVKEYDKDLDARNSLRYTIEQRLKELYHKAKNDIELIEVYLKSRNYIYKIENDDFNEDDYAKEIAPRVYNQFINRVIDGRFELTSDKKELPILKDIENCEIKDVKRLNSKIEFAYKKDSEIKYLTIENKYYMSSMSGLGMFFKVFNLDSSTISNNEKSKLIFSDIKEIVKIFHLEDIQMYHREDRIEILYKTKDGLINSYRLYFNHVEEEMISFDMKKYEDIFSFNTRVLDDKNKTQISYSYSNKYFTPMIEYNCLEEVYDEFKDPENLSPQITRKKGGYYDLDYPCTTFGKKVHFIKEESGGILAYNISHSHLFNPMSLPNKEIYNYLNEEEKSKLHHFLAIAQLYLNDLYVNREFDNTFIIDSFINPKENERIEKLEERLETCNWIKKRYYDDAEQGHPAGMLVDIYYKENDKDKNFVVFNENDWLNFKYIVKYNDNAKQDVEELLKEVM